MDRRMRLLHYCSNAESSLQCQGQEYHHSAASDLLPYRNRLSCQEFEFLTVHGTVTVGKRYICVYFMTVHYVVPVYRNIQWCSESHLGIHQAADELETHAMCKKESYSVKWTIIAIQLITITNRKYAVNGPEVNNITAWLRPHGGYQLFWRRWSWPYQLVWPSFHFERLFTVYTADAARW